MNSRSCKRLLSILVCLAMVMTQMVPLSFADTAGIDADQAPVSDGAEAAGDDNGQAADGSVSDEGSVSNDENAQESVDAAEEGGSSDAPSSIKDKIAGLLGIELLDGESAGGSEETAEEDIDPQLSWYLKDKNAKEFEISNAQQMYGLAKIVNGVAKAKVKDETTGAIKDGVAVARDLFAGKTIKLTDDIDLSEVTDEQWTRIGYSSLTYAFKGTFDGCGHTISGLKIQDVAADTSTVYAGLFGYLSGAVIKNFDLSGEVALTVDGTKRTTGGKNVYVAPVAAYARDGSTISGIDVDMEYTGQIVNNYLYFGGVVGYIVGSTSAKSYITDCTVTGSYAMETAAYVPSNVAATSYTNVGGIAGYAEYTVIENCTSDLDITSYARCIGGIVGYMKGASSAVTDCVNNGSLVSLGACGDDYIGGIAGYYTDTTIKTDKTFANIINTGNIQATKTWHKKSSSAAYADFHAGGILGYSDRANVLNALNTGNLIIPDNTDEARIWSGGLIGDQINSSLENGVALGKTVYKSYAAGEEDSISRISNIGASATVKSVLKNCFITDSKTDDTNAVNMAENENAEIASIGVINKNNAVSAYSGDYPLLYDAKTLGQALNAYVIKNGDGSDVWRMWNADGSVYRPEGSTAASPAAAAVKMSVKTSGDADFKEADSASDAAGNNIVLKAEISAPKNRSGESSLSYQWYASKTPGSAGAEALTGAGASGAISGLSGEATYTVTSEEYSQLYYFVKVTNTVTYIDAESGEAIAESSAATDGAKIELTFTKEQTGFNGETADAFESGSGTAASPYIIADASQLKRMEVMVNSSDTTYRSAYYKLGADIDYRNVSWTPMGGTAAATAFAGTFDGAGYTIKNIKIVADKKTAGLFSFISAPAVIKNLTVTGSMYVSNTKYAGGIIGYSAGAVELGDLTNGMDITADDVQNVGGIVGWLSGGPEIYNCINAGDVYMTADPSATAVYGTSASGYAAGVMGYTSSFARIYNCENTGDITAAKASGAAGNANLYAAGIFCAANTGSGLNCVNYGNIKAIGSAAAKSTSPIRIGGSGNDLNCFDMSAGDTDNETALKALNDFVITRITWATYQKSRTWIEENGSVAPAGPKLTAPEEPVTAVSVKVGDGEFIRTNNAVNASCSQTVTLKADIQVGATATGDPTVTYQWYKMASADGAGKTALSGANASGTLEGLKQEIEYSISSDSYSDAYYMVEITNTVSYAKSGVDLSLSSTVDSSPMNIIFKKGDGSYEGEVSESLKKSETAENTYLISSAADLMLMQKNINENAAGYSTANYQLTADINFNGIKLNTIGSKTIPFKGTFDGAGHKISNVNIVTVKDGSTGFTALFGYLDGATVKDLTIEGSMEASAVSQYTAAIAGWAANASKIINCTADIDMAVEKAAGISTASYTGGIAGYMNTASVENSANLGNITVTSTGSGSASKVGGIAGSVTGLITTNGKVPAKWAADRSIYNSYNSGNIKIITGDESSTRTFIVGGIAAEITTAAVVNSANTGDIASVGCGGVSPAHNIGGIAYSLAYGTSGAAAVRNCASFGSITADTSNVDIYTGIASVADGGYSKSGELSYVYASDAEGLDKVFGVKTTTASYVIPQTGIGAFDAETGNITNITVSKGVAAEAAASDYVRTDGVRKLLNGEGKTDVYYALNAWTGMNTTDTEKYNSWTPVEGKAGAYAPAGSAKVSPFAADSSVLNATLSDAAYKDKIFEPVAELPALTVELTGADSSAVYHYSWYKSKSADGSDRELIADAADSASYTPKTDPGKYYYSAEAYTVNGEYFKKASSGYVGVTTKSDKWNGDSAGIGTLTGTGTEADPYIIDTPEKLALISSGFITGTNGYYSNKPTVAEGKTGEAFGSAYFRITEDLDMNGSSYSFKSIGSSSNVFKGHLYGKKADGSIPVIKDLHISAGSAPSYVGLFAQISAGGSVEDLVFENAKIEVSSSSTMYIGVAAAKIGGTASAPSKIRNVSVSGEIKLLAGSASVMNIGAIAGNADSYSSIEDCVNNAAVTVESSYSGAVCANTGGITGKVSGVIKNCVNNGAISGADENTSYGTGGIAGIASKATGDINIIGCKNTAGVTGHRNVGGIIGFFNWGSAESCYNTGNVTTKNIPANTTSSSYANIGGIAGNMTSYQAATPVSISSCYNTGAITDEAAGAEIENRAGLIAGYAASSMIIDHCYALAQDGIGIYHSRGSASGTFALEAKTGDASELKTTDAAAYIGGLFYKKDNSAPVLENEVAKDDRCKLTIAASGDDTAKAYIMAGENKVSSVNVVKGSTAELSLISSMGYSIASLKNGAAEISAVNGIYTIIPETSATLTAELVKTPETAAFLTDYNGTGEGQRMLVYRNTDGIEPGYGVFFGNIQLIHASAFDSASFAESSSAAGFVSADGKKLEKPVYTYVAFIDDDTLITDVDITVKQTENTAEVDYENRDILGDGEVDVFDAQRIWDLMKNKEGTKATDLQRLNADLNHDGVIDIKDVLNVHAYIISKVK